MVIIWLMMVNNNLVGGFIPTIGENKQMFQTTNQIHIYIYLIPNNHSPLLVGGFNHLEKYEFVNGKDDIPYMKWKITFMFETTNQTSN